MTDAERKRFAGLVAALSSRLREEKLQAIKAMRLLRLPEHADALTDLLATPDEEILVETLLALGRIGHPRSLKYVLDFVPSDRPVVAAAALEALAGFNILPVLDLILHSAAPDRPVPLRKPIITLIAEINDIRVATLMGEILGQSQDPHLLAEALGYFTRFPSPDRLDALRKLAGSGQWEVALGANIALSRLKDEAARGHLKRLLKSPAHPIRMALVQGLRRRPLIEDRELFQGLFTDSHPGVRLAALEGLTLFAADERVRLLTEWLPKEKDEGVRQALFAKAALENHPALYPVFLPFLSSSSPEQRRLGVEALSAMGERIIDRLLAEFDRLPLVIREQLLLVMGNIGGNQALEKVLGCLDSRERWIRINAIDSLARLQAFAAGPRLVEMLARPDLDVWVRATIVSVLGRLEFPRGRKVLLDHLVHKDARVRANAVEGLVRSGDHTLSDVLRRFLEDPNDRVRVNAAIGMWRLGDVSVIPALVAMTKNPSKWVRSSAAFALGEIGDKSATPSLLDLLTDKEELVYRNVVEALGKIGDARALLPLLEESQKNRLDPAQIEKTLEDLSAKLR
jgi:HEAT repeat protein